MWSLTALSFQPLTFFDTSHSAASFISGQTLQDALKQRSEAPGEAWIRALLSPLMEALAVLHGDTRALETSNGNVVLDLRPLVLKLGDRFEVLATNTLSDQSFIASPIVVDGDIYLRSQTHLFRIGAR